MARASWWGQAVEGTPFRRGDLAFVGVFVVVIVTINKGVIRDQGSAWASVVMFSAGWGLILVCLNRWRLERSRRP